MNMAPKTDERHKNRSTGRTDGHLMAHLHDAHKGDHDVLENLSGNDPHEDEEQNSSDSGHLVHRSSSSMRSSPSMSRTGSGVDGEVQLSDLCRPTVPLKHWKAISQKDQDAWD